VLERQSVEQLWQIDLDKFETAYRKDLEARGCSERGAQRADLENGCD